MKYKRVRRIIPYTVWGNYWYMMHGGESENRFIESLLIDGEADSLIDGEADSFALECYPTLRPQWLFGLPTAEVRRLWEEVYRPIVHRTDVDYSSYMFGHAEQGIPWCAGYAVGYFLVQTCLQTFGGSAVALLERKSEELLEQLEKTETG